MQVFGAIPVGRMKARLSNEAKHVLVGAEIKRKPALPQTGQVRLAALSTPTAHFPVPSPLRFAA